MSEISVVVVGSTSISSVVGNGDTVNINVGDQTIGGGDGSAATIEVGTVQTVDATQSASVVNSGTAYAAKFDFSIPRGVSGLTGPAGPATTLSIGSVTTGTTAAVSITGNAPSQQVSFVLPQGPKGDSGAQGLPGAPASLSIGSVSTGATAAVTVTGTAPSQQLSFVLQPGPANSLSVGSVSTGASAAVSITGIAPSQQISFVIPPGPASTLKIGGVSSGPTAAATITGSGTTQTLNLVLPQGVTGAQGPVGPSGPANSLSLGSVTTGTSAAVSITGSAPSQKISFVLPQGPQGQTPALKIGTVVTGADAAATITGTGLTQTLNLVLPQGATGSQGPQGNAGPANSLSIGSVSTGATAAVSISGSSPSQTLSFVLQPGPTGPANSLSIGSVSTGTTAAVSITGAAPSQSLSFVLPQGPAGPPNSLSVGSVSTGATAAVSVSGTAPSQTLSFVLQPGPTGPANSLSIGSVTTGTTAAVSISGTAPSQSLSFVLQPGPAGPANSLSIGSVSTGTTAAVSITGTAPSQSISFVLPVGPKGDTGATGPAGPPINLGDETPQPLGVASAGTAVNAARADHVHATLTSFPYGSLTGVPSTFTPSAHAHAVSDVTGLQTALDGKQAAGSYAPLVNSQIPSSYLPSFVDDVIDVGGTLPASGDVGKIYVVSTGTNTNKIYRWSGSAFIEISPSPGSTDSVTEGSTNLYHTNARAAAAAPVQSVNAKTGTVTLTAADVGAATTSHKHPLADLSQSSATTGQVPTWDGTAWTAATPSPGGVISVAGQTGTVTLAQLGSSGTASSTTFLRGDGAWATAGSTDAGDLVTGKLAAARLPFATTTAAGAVIVGSGLSVASGVLSVDAPFPAPSSVYYDDGVRVTSVVGATLYELQYTTDGGSTYTSVGTYAPLAGATQAYALSNSGGKKFRARAYNANNVAGEWGYESGITIPGGGSANIVEAATASAFPATGSSGTLYIATDVSRIYRWSGSVYVEIGTSGGSGSGSDDPRWDYFTPSAPTSVTATAGNAQATVSWTAPTGVIAQAPITDYVVQFRQGSGSWETFSDGTSTATSATVTGLTNVTAYTFRVAAVNAIGQGQWSAASSAVTPSAGTPPGAPTGLTATAGNAQISLAWTAPSSGGSSAITGYSVEYTPSGGSAVTVNTGSTATSYTLTGLTNGTAYTARVAAVNAVGTGSYSAASSAVTPSAATLSVSPSSGTPDSGVAYSWSGSGTAASPLQTDDAAAPSGTGWGDSTVLSWSFTCGSSGTLTIEFGGRENEGPEIPVLNNYVKNGSVSTTFAGSQTYFGTYGARRTISVSAGDVIGRLVFHAYSPKGRFRLWIS